MEQIKLTGRHRTYAEWDASLSNYLAPGDSVDAKLQSHFLEVVFPAYFDSTLTQMGEPADHVAAGPRFETIQRHHDGRWIYTGLRTLRERVELR